MADTDNILAEYSLTDYKRIIRGLAAPKESGEHKQATMALTRIFGPSSISLLLCLMVLGALFTLVASKTIQQSRTVEVTMMEAEVVKLDKIEDLMKELEKEPIDTSPVDMPSLNDVPMDAPPVDAPVMNEAMVLTAPVPLLTKSPLIIKNLYGGRMTAASRAGALKANRGSAKGEDAVLRALRWLKKKQDPDGSWKSSDNRDHVAMAGLGLLTFLAHGETPQSEEFGPTVEKAIHFLIDHQAKRGPSGQLSQDAYVHGICTYALAEAYALTKIMPIKDAMEKAITFLMQGQQETGGFHYYYAKGDKFDVSVSGWNIQALKAATMAGSSNTNLPAAVAKAIMFLKTQAYAQDGSGFVYQGKPGEPSAKGGTASMTAVGTLCLQLLGHARDPEAKQGVTVLETETCVWHPKDGHPRLYGWYYITQAKFQNSEASFNAWNEQFNKQFVDAQIREDDGCGYWPVGDYGGPVYATTLATLCLEVYYRYLPTYKKAEDTETVTATATDDLKIEIL